MAVFWTIVTFVFTFGVLGLVAFAVVWMFTGPHDHETPMGGRSAFTG